MPAAKPRAIIFDIGRVLIGIDVARAMSGLAAGLSLTPEELWHSLEKDPRWRDWQEGRIPPHDWNLYINKRFSRELTYDQFAEVWNQVLHPEPLQDIDFLRRLGKKYKLALLSNTDPVHVAYMEAKYEFFSVFPVRTYSSVVGATKPSPIIYREALRGCGVKAPEAIYIDDIPAYVEAAQALGMRGICYKSAEQLKLALAEFGVAT